jgi:hypothetical protein
MREGDAWGVRRSERSGKKPEIGDLPQIKWTRRMVMKRKSLIMVLCLAVVLVAGLPAMATSWDPYYTLSEPTTPPGGAGWGYLDPGAWVWLNPGDSVWVGALNSYQANAIKTGYITVFYQAGGVPLPLGQSRLIPTEFAVGGQPGPRPASWDNPSKTYIENYGGYEEISPTGDFITGTSQTGLNFFPQPGWEWVRYENVSSGQVWADGAWIDTYCHTVPIPGAVWLLGSGLLGLAGWRRTRKS